MCKDIYTLKCEVCNNTWKEEVDGNWEVDWECKKCKSTEDVFCIDYQPGDKDFYNRKVDIGMKAGNPNTAWKR